MATNEYYRYAASKDKFHHNLLRFLLGDAVANDLIGNLNALTDGLGFTKYNPKESDIYVNTPTGYESYGTGVEQILNLLESKNLNTDWLDNYSNSELKALFSEYLNANGEVYDIDNIVSDFEKLSSLGDLPVLPEDTRWTSEEIQDYIRSGGDSFYNAAASRLQDSRDAQVQAANEAYAQLEGDLGLMSSMFNRQKEALSDAFEQSSSNLRSQQYLANAQTYDALRSDLRRSRQNALEAGASAGVRIASNVNALLTAQNKQSATAMETSNALAEMLLQHRNAMSGLTRDYANYRTNTHNAMASHNQRAADAQTNYNTGMTNLENDTVDRIHNQQQGDYDRANEKYIRDVDIWERSSKGISDNPIGNAYIANKNLNYGR